MEKRIKLIAGGLFAVLVLAFGIWFWSLGAVASEDVPAIRVETTKQSVEFKQKDSADWKKVETAQEVGVGDMVRTDKDGAAQIRWGDRGVTRLDPDTTLTIEEVPADPSSVTHAAIKLRLETGRVWSRVLKLFGPESAFEVKTNSVVATVRGTAYGTSITGSSTAITVNEGVVEAAPSKGGNGTFVRQGKLGEFGGDGSLRSLRDLGPQDEWAGANRNLDKIFDEDLANETAMRFARLQKPAPEWLTELSEDMRLRFAGGSKDLSGYYARRRIAALALGRNVSMESISRLVPTMVGKSRELTLGNVRLALQMVRTPAVGKRFGDPGVHKLDALETLRTALLTDGMPGEIDARLVYLSESIVRAWSDNDGKNVGSLQRDVSDLRLQISNSPDLSGGARNKMDRDALALLDFGGVPVAETSSTTEGTAASTSTPETQGQDSTQTPSGSQPPNQVTNPKSPAGSVVKPETSCEYRLLTLMAKPDRGIKVGDAVSLALYGNCPDGRTDDLTGQASFNPGLTTDGKIDGRVFYPAKDGTIRIYATLQLNGRMRSADTSITVDKTPKRLTGVKVLALGPTTITTGQSVPLQATAAYSDGSTTDVTYQCQWMTSNARLAMVSNQRLQSLSGTGDVSATCNYSENGVNVFGSIMVTIQLDPALQPRTTNPTGSKLPGFTLY
ncbi:MAG: FecR family protein [Patescibacteria group bacterium]